jgi:hypothetical protein
MRIAIFVAAFAMAACNSAQRAPVATASSAVPITLSKAQIESIKAGVAKDLKDPESARFGDSFRAVESSGAIIVCGYVNAKNSYGGYIGEKPFIASGGRAGPFALIGLGGRIYGRDDIGSGAVREQCAENGITI